MCARSGNESLDLSSRVAFILRIGPTDSNWSLAPFGTCLPQTAAALATMIIYKDVLTGMAPERACGAARRAHGVQAMRCSAMRTP